MKTVHWRHVSTSWFTGGKPKGDETGKYLFFASDPKVLQDVGNTLLTEHGFNVCKIATKAVGGSHVLCVYWKDDSRKQELADLMADWDLEAQVGVMYRYWKSDADTKAKKYSPKFLQALKEKATDNQRAEEDANGQYDEEYWRDFADALDIPF